VSFEIFPKSLNLATPPSGKMLNLIWVIVDLEEILKK